MYTLLKPCTVIGLCMCTECLYLRSLKTYLASATVSGFYDKISDMFLFRNRHWLHIIPRQLIHICTCNPGPEIIFLSCSTQLSTKFFLLINVKMPTIVGILTFMSRKNSILGLSEHEKAEFLDIFILTSI